jgi:hypothetical protein
MSTPQTLSHCTTTLPPADPLQGSRRVEVLSHRVCLMTSLETSGMYHHTRTHPSRSAPSIHLVVVIRFIQLLQDEGRVILLQTGPQRVYRLPKGVQRSNKKLLNTT